MSKRPRGKGKGVLYGQARGGRIPDPYIPRKGLPEPTLCPICGAVYQRKHWSIDEKVALEVKRKGKVNSEKCPACRKIEDGFAMGIIDLTGDFVVEHMGDIVNTVRSEERRAMEKNPLERIIRLEKIRTGGIRVETTTDSLALRIGRLLNRAYKGDTRFDWHYGDKSVDIKWHREK